MGTVEHALHEDRAALVVEIEELDQGREVAQPRLRAREANLRGRGSSAGQIPHKGIEKCRLEPHTSGEFSSSQDIIIDFFRRTSVPTVKERERERAPLFVR